MTHLDIWIIPWVTTHSFYYYFPSHGASLWDVKWFILSCICTFPPVYIISNPPHFMLYFLRLVLWCWCTKRFVSGCPGGPGCRISGATKTRALKTNAEWRFASVVLDSSETSTSRATHIKASLNICRPGSNARVDVEDPWGLQCQLKELIKGPRLGLVTCGAAAEDKCLPI